MSIIKLESFLLYGSKQEYPNNPYWAKQGIIFNEKQPTTSYVYTDADGAADSDGWINCGFFLTKSFQINMNIGTMTDITVKIEGRVHDNMPPAIHLEKAYTSTQTDFIQLAERVKWIRVGINGAGTANANDWIWVGFNMSR